jgi:hypothetical protein
MLSSFLLLAVLGLSGALVQIYREREQLQQALHRYSSLPSKEEKERQLDLDIRELLKAKEQLNIEVKSLQKNTLAHQEENYLQSLGFYAPKYDFIRSEDYQHRFDQITAERKQMFKNGSAIISYKTWIVGEDSKEGRKKGKAMTDNHIKTTLETFDIICDSAVSDAKMGNINRLRNRIISTFEKLNKRSKVLECEIRVDYLNLRLKELDIKYEMELKKQEEKERDQLIRDQMKREKKEREEAEKARQEEEEAAERKRQYQEEREKIRQEMSRAVGSQLEELERQKIRYEALIVKAQKDEEDAIDRRRGLKSGTIYVLSSIGSLEKDVCRIFMTQNSEPDKYVRNMNPYVPFPFNIRFKIYSEDVSATLQRLHERFSDRRVNTVNLRREFFKISLDEVRKEAYAIRSETTEFRINIQEFEDIPLENEYLRTLAERAKKQL